ncbi:ROK family protein [bacterium]|nr:ROK family protein [bacterium]
MRLTNRECVLALDAGGTAAKIGIVARAEAADSAADAGGARANPGAAADAGAGWRVLDAREIPMPSTGSAEEIAEAYAAAARMGLSCAAARGLSAAGVGVSTPGPFDYGAGVSLMRHKYAAIEGMSVRGFIGRATGGLPVRFIHDAFAFLLGALAYSDGAADAGEGRVGGGSAGGCEGAAAGRSVGANVCGATIGTGLGFAAMVGGRLLRNASGGPAISVYAAPYLDGIAEDYVSRRGVEGCYSRRGGRGSPTVKEMAAAARSGDALCAGVFEETGTHLARILAPIVQKGGYGTLFLGGQIAKAGELLAAPARRAFAELGISCEVAPAARIDEAPLLGAARLFLDEEVL